MIVAIKFIMILISISSFFTVKLKFKQENSMLITLLSIGIFLYILGVLNIMKIGLYVIIILALMSAVYVIYKLVKKQAKLNEIFTIGTVLYILAILIVSVLTRDTYYRNWDEFSHWGSNLKAMVNYNVLWSSNLYDGVHVVYPPLAGIIEYFMCKLNGQFVESVSYFAVDVFVITLLIPILRNLKYNFKDAFKGILTMFSVCCLIYIFGFQLTSIYIDLILAMLFAIGMYISFKEESIEDKVLIGLILVSLVVLKDTGLVLAGIILIQLGINKVIVPIIKNKKITKNEFKKLGILFMVLLVIGLSYASWKMYCSSNGKVLDYRHDTNSIAQINIKDFIKAVIQIRCPEGKLLDISNSFYNALNSTALISKYPCTTAIQLLVIFDIIGIIIYCITTQKEEKRKILVLWITMNIGFVLYCLLLMATYMFAFTEPEGRSLASYERYMPTYFIAWATIIIAMFSNIKKNEIKSLLIISLICLYGMNIKTFIEPTTKNNSAISQEIISESKVILDNVDLSDKVYIIYQESNGYEFHQLRYCISPIITNLVCEWSLGEPTYNGFIWNYNISEEEFEQKLIEEEFDYVFVAKSDENLTSKYGQVFDENVELSNLDNKLFKVNKINDNNIILTEYVK